MLILLLLKVAGADFERAYCRAYWEDTVVSAMLLVAYTVQIITANITKT